MKVGILTFHRANNYGAVLQCYALQTYLTKIGLDVDVINYKQPAIEKTYSTFSKALFCEKILHPLDLLKYLNNVPNRFIRNYKFSKFRNNLLHISRVFNPNELFPYDIVFHGSDQIWNPKLTGNILDRIYLGFYKQNVNGKKIAYAVSFENKQISNELASVYNLGIKNFDAISLREHSLKVLLAPFTDMELRTTVDPTLLLSRKDYDTIAENVDEKHPYVLVYAVGPKKLALEIAYRIAEERNLKVVDITNMNITPNKFIGYFKYASFVVAVSFHGTIFSLIYKRNFYTVATGQTSDVRYHDLLNNMQLGSRCINCIPDKITDVDYTSFESNLNKYIKSSKEFIKTNLCLK